MVDRSITPRWRDPTSSAQQRQYVVIKVDDGRLPAVASAAHIINVF